MSKVSAALSRGVIEHRAIHEILGFGQTVAKHKQQYMVFGILNALPSLQVEAQILQMASEDPFVAQIETWALDICEEAPEHLDALNQMFTSINDLRHEESIKVCCRLVHIYFIIVFFLIYAMCSWIAYA